MQFKTTAFMAVVLLVLMGWFLVERPDDRSRPATPEASPTPADAGQRPVFEDVPEGDDISTVVATREGQSPWRFARTGEGEEASKGWEMVEPIKTTVPKWDIERIVRTVRELKYQIRYAPDDPEGVSAVHAGLDPPRYRVAILDDEGGEWAIDVGKPASRNETYVRVKGQSDILVARGSLESLVKKSVNDYRDKSLIKFVANDARSMEVLYRPEGGEPVEYRLVRHDGGDWVFEEPFSADADDKAIDAAIMAASRLGATEWVDVDPREGFRLYGLTMPMLDVEIETETTTSVESEDDSGDSDDSDDGDGETEPTVTTETHRYAFQISGRGPLGKDTLVYFKHGDPEADAVAVIAKSSADKFVPVLEEWRDMDVCPTPIIGAVQVVIRTGEDPPLTLTKNDQDGWMCQELEAKADAEAVGTLLRTIDELKALNFVDAADPADAKFGFDRPTVEIVVTVPGHDQPEVIAVGNSTDPNSNRVFYVRRGQSRSIAKVRVADVEILRREPIRYVDRKIIEVAAGDLKRIEVTRRQPQSESITLSRVGDSWRITSPVDARTETGVTVKLASTLAKLSAEQVVTLSGDAGSYGLDAPTVSLSLTYRGPAMVGEGDDVPAPVDQTLVLHVTDHGGDVFAKREDTPTVYQLRRADYDVMLAEFHDRTVLDFQQSQAVSVAVTTGDVTLAFTKKDDGWIYASEPDLPIDPKKVTNLLLQLQDLKLTRYVAYGASDLGSFGLDKPVKSVTVKTDEGRSITLLVGASSGRSVHAVLQGSRDVFLLTPDDVARFEISLDEFEKAADS